jgi:hypothetical protein
MSQRVVLDTNCVISALLFSKQSMAWLRHSWQNARITPLASKDTVKELMRVLAYPKFKLSTDEQALLLADFLPYTETVIIEQTPDDLPLIRDPDDQKFLILAVVGQAEVLVTGDADILAIQSSFHTPPIMTLAEYKDWLKL